MGSASLHLVTVSPATAHTGRALVSAAPGVRLPRREHSTGGVAVGTSCNSYSAAPRDCCCQDWSLAESGTGLVTICPSGAVRRVWRGNATLFSSSECDCSSSISGYGTTQPDRAHIPDRSGIRTHQTLLSFCSSSSGRAGEWELGVHHGWKDLSFSSHQTTLTAHSQP